MADNPLASKPDAPSSFGSPRRSTRVNFVTPVILTGRDASGQLFREQTQTIIVNLHGCRLRTIHKVMVGMLFMVECPEAGTGGEAVCVHVWDSPSGEPACEVALQLVKPQNLWGIKDPPADWEEVAENLVLGRLPRTRRDFNPPLVSLKTRPGASVSSEGPALPSVDLLLGELEQRAAQLMEFVLQLIRNETDEVLRRRLQEFRQQIDAIVKDAEARLRQHSQVTCEETRSSLDSLRSDSIAQLGKQTAEVVESAEQTVRAKVGELFEALLKPSTGDPDRRAPKE